jgi:hypothetical protein
MDKTRMPTRQSTSASPTSRTLTLTILSSRDFFFGTISQCSDASAVAGLDALEFVRLESLVSAATGFSSLRRT